MTERADLENEDPRICERHEIADGRASPSCDDCQPVRADGGKTADGTYRLMTCADCGSDYPLGGSVLQNPVENSPESAEHHSRWCPVRGALMRRGQTEERESYVGVDRDD